MSSETPIETVESEIVDKKKGENKKQEESLKECQKILDSKVNTEDLISAVEQKPAVWDASSEAYSNKQLKLNAWNEIISSFIPDFEQRSLVERNNLSKYLIKHYIIPLVVLFERKFHYTKFYLNFLGRLLSSNCGLITLFQLQK